MAPVAAKMGDLAVDPQTGQLYQLGPGGWKPTSQEAAFAPQGVIPSAARSTAEMVAGIGNLAFGGGFEAPGAAEAQQAGMNQSPLATTIGSLLPDAAMMAQPAMGIAGATARVPMRMAERVAGRIGATAERAGARVPPAAAQGADMAGRSVGAAEVGGASRSAYEAAQRIMDDVLGSSPMTADQAALVPVAEKMGFEFLPGMKGRMGSPGRQILAGSLSRPQLSYVFADTLEANAAIPEKAFMAAIGKPGAPLSTAGQAEAVAAMRQGFNEVRDSLPETLKLPEAWVKEAQDVGKNATDIKLTIAEDGTISREDLFRLRSDLNATAGDMVGKQGRSVLGNRMGRLVTGIDDFIKGQLGEANAAKWKTLRERWLIHELSKRPGAMTPTGELSWRTWRGVLDREMPDAYRQILEGPRDNLSPETAQFMDTIKVANAFGDLMPNSGTATRQALLGSGMGWKEKGSAWIMRSLMRQARDAENAATLAGAAP